MRSADLSRQVGAIIVNPEGDVISTGANDVPKASGGQYWPGKDDKRDHVLGYDSNEKEKNEIILKILRQFNQYNEGLDEQENINIAKGKLKDTGLLDITEYGRAVHAEMEALLTASRNGVAVRGGTLFTTTFPCHNCTKHLITAGIKEVIYIEPYPKSFATKLHADSIVVSNQTSLDDPRITFKQFVGIGPRKFIDLFSMKLGDGRKLKRKEKGKLSEWKRQSAEVRVPMFPLSYLEREVILNNELEELIHNYKENQNG
jgi:deoxycytidylate deaminase